MSANHPRTGAALLPERQGTLTDAMQLAWHGRLFAILDACDMPAIPPKARALGERAVSLYAGSADEDHWAIAPYLVAVDRATLDWMLHTVWNEPWGILIEADATMETLRTHVRRFLTVRHPDGRAVYFRFYDPRVLPVLLRHSSDAELTDFFGPVGAFGVAAPGATSLTWFALAAGLRATGPVP